MKKTFLAAAAVAAMAIAAAPVAQAADAPKQATTPAKPATAAAKPGAAAPAKPTPAQIANLQRAARILRAFNAVLEAKETKPEVRSALLVCMYNNKLATISAAAGQAMAKNPALKEDNLNDVLHAAGGVCGLKFNPPPAGTSPAPAKPAGPAPTPRPATPPAGTNGR